MIALETLFADDLLRKDKNEEFDEEEMKKDLVADDSSYCLSDDEEICHHKIISEHLSSLHL